MKFTTDGLIIKENNVGESDRVVVVLTRDRGLLSAFVTGARKPNSKTGAATALLSFSSLTFTHTKDTYRITEAETQNVFFDLRSDIYKFSLAQYICELCQILVPYEIESEDFLRLALNSLHFIAKGNKNLYLLKAVTELRMMVIAGFMPNLIGCKECGCDNNFPIFLDFLGGEIICSNCKAHDNTPVSFFELPATVFTAMRHIVYSDFSKIYSFEVPEPTAKYLSFITERYLTAQTGHKFKTLDFFHSLETGL